MSLQSKVPAGVNQAYNMKQYRQALKRTQGLLRITTLLSSAYTKEAVAKAIINEGFTILGAHNGDIALLKNKYELEVIASKGYPKDFIRQWPDIPKGTPLLTTHVIKTKRPYYIKNIDDLDEKYTVAKSFMATSGAHSAALLPLMLKKKVIGVIQFTFQKPHTFNKDDKILMDLLSHQCALSFERVLALEHLKTSKNQLEKILKQMRELDLRKDDFISMASHELKTPLTSMHIFLELLNRRLLASDTTAHTYLRKTTQQMDRLQRLVNDLLDASRIQQGKLRYTKELFDLDELMRSTIDELQLTYPKYDVTLQAMDDIHVYGDKLRIYQVINNLITNAIKYSPAGSEIHLVLHKDSTMAIVSITDKGIGISKEHQQKIFDRFYQVTDVVEKTYGGIGMGLYIATEVIKDHGGKLWVESEKGKGSTFSFSLPISKSV